MQANDDSKTTAVKDELSVLTAAWQYERDFNARLEDFAVKVKSGELTPTELDVNGQALRGDLMQLLHLYTTLCSATAFSTEKSYGSRVDAARTQLILGGLRTLAHETFRGFDTAHAQIANAHAALSTLQLAFDSQLRTLSTVTEEFSIKALPLLNDAVWSAEKHSVSLEYLEQWSAPWHVT